MRFWTTRFVMLLAGALSVPSIADAQSWGGGPRPRDGACFYKDANFRGQFFCVEADDDRESMPSGANDEISSIRIYGRAEVTVYEGSRFRGESLRFDSDVRDLQAENFNDTISSLQIERRSRGRDRNGDTMTRGRAEAIVRRAYLAVLEREPDPESRGYVDRVLRDKWTQEDVERELRKSAEYRRRRR